MVVGSGLREMWVKGLGLPWRLGRVKKKKKKWLVVVRVSRGLIFYSGFWV